MRAWGATPKTNNFWHGAFQTRPYQASKNTAGGIFGAEVCALGAPRQKRTFYGIVHFKDTHTSYPKTLRVAYLVQSYVLGVPRQKRTVLWHCAIQTHLCYVSQK